ncbi:YczE/YyaS/YitT family protein [Lentzea sp. HUAS TT2]|uniref:YczE/YyaS/YitT family protein n=1 Tax=Lentzea sp. HUAS TT2 TaxID=3447454 RepID=UPI003F726027
MPTDPAQEQPASEVSGSRPFVVRLGQVVVGNALMGVAVGMLVNAALGLLPLDVFHRAVGDRFGWTIGGTIIAVQSTLLVLNLALRVKPGIGTVTSAVIPAVVADLTLAVLPAPQVVWLRVMAMLLGGAMFAVGTALYLSAELGALPRDGLMVAIARRTDWSPARIRIGADVLCLLTGVLMINPAIAVANGSLGAGSVLLAVALGPSIATLVPLFTHRPQRNARVRGET